MGLTVDNQLIMRMRAFDTQQNMFNLRGEDIDAANHNHIIGSAFDLTGAGAGPAALAGLVGHADDIPCPVANQGNPLLGQCGNDQFAIVTFGHRLAGFGVDDFRVENVGE